MGKLLNADYRQVMLFPPSLEELVPPDHPVRLIRELVDEAVKQGRLPADVPRSEEGRPEYAPSLLLKIWLYAYILKYRSTRKAEWACRNVMPMVWLCGGLHPDHNTLSRFWKQQQALIREFYRTTIKIAFDLDMIGMVLHGVDGTKIQASGSTRRAMDQKQARALLERLERSIAEIEQSIARDEDQFGEEPKLPPNLTDSKRLREAVSAALELWEGLPTSKRTLSEPEARMLVGVGMGYNAQVVVDAKDGIIVAQDLVTDASDQHQLVPMLDKLKEELGKTASLTVADGGYNTAEALGEAAQRGHEVVLNRSGDEQKAVSRPYHSSHFIYDAEEDIVTCPQGKRLEFHRIQNRKKRGQVRIYLGTECADCPVRSSCVKRGRRKIEIGPHHAAVVANRKRREEPDIKAQLRSRITFGERPFATIKNLLGMIRFRLRGRAGATLEWVFTTAVHNVLLMLRAKEKRQLALA
jgi:transposase